VNSRKGVKSVKSINEKINDASNTSTVKPVYNDHPWDPKLVAVVDRGSLFRGYLSSKTPIWDIKMVVVIDRWSLFGGGPLAQV